MGFQGGQHYRSDGGREIQMYHIQRDSNYVLKDCSDTSLCSKPFHSNWLCDPGAEARSIYWHVTAEGNEDSRFRETVNHLRSWRERTRICAYPLTLGALSP